MEKSKKKMYARYILLRLLMVLFDILAVNLSYFVALIVRFYVNFKLNEWAVQYVPAFVKFAPAYTVCCLVIFWAFKLYNNRWKYAGLGELNRILAASLATCVVQVVGSVVFVMRMPITYYVIGAVIQFVLIAGSRFSYQVFTMERERAKAKRRSNETTVNVMIVGVGDTCHVMLKHLEQDADNAARPVCLVDFRADGMGDMMLGLPVIGGVEKIADALKKYAVEYVILADATMPQSVRKQIREICAEQKVEVQDFSGYLQDSRGAVTLLSLMEYTKGPVELVINGVHQTFDCGEQAALFATGKYIVKSVCAKDSRLVVELQKDVLVPNDVKEDWVRSYQQESGEDISFF